VGDQPNRLSAIQDIEQPIVDRSKVTDRKCRFVADPFLVKEQSTTHDNSHLAYYLFFEAQSDQGDIAVAKSVDLQNWVYLGVVLDENIHLSFPYVFRYHRKWFMMPETNWWKEIRLYEATNFPFGWVKSRTLLQGEEYIDSAILYYEERWYIFTSIHPGDNLYLFHSSHLFGEFEPHPLSPLRTGDYHLARNAGRIVIAQPDAQLHGQKCIAWRFAMDNRRQYGEAVTAVCISKLSETQYDEVIDDKRTLSGTLNKHEWNGNNMHHIDLHNRDELIEGFDNIDSQSLLGKATQKYIAIVDGCGRMIDALNQPD